MQSCTWQGTVRSGLAHPHIPLSSFGLAHSTSGPEFTGLDGWRTDELGSGAGMIEMRSGGDRGESSGGGARRGLMGGMMTKPRKSVAQPGRF